MTMSCRSGCAQLLLFCSMLVFSLGGRVSAGPPPARFVHIRGTDFVETATNSTIVMTGPNVVVKGPPYLPAVEGSTICNDTVNAECTAAGTCTSCFTFNQHDVDYIKSQGWNTIRLGVVWAGAQPRDVDALDADFVERLHAILNLTDQNKINVILDNHGDMVGSAGCGNGIPMWFQKKAAPELIGKPLVSGFPYNIFQPISKVYGYDFCGPDSPKWAEHAGDPNYNLLNECCQAMNARSAVPDSNPGGLGYTTISQKTMDYLVQPGPGRDDFVRFWKLLSEVVARHPSAVAAELINEPMTIRRNYMFDTWRACAEAINAIIPDMSVNICDVGEGAVLPSWVTKILGAGVAINKDTVDWIKASKTIFYSWHWYGLVGLTVDDAIKNVQAISRDWQVPTFATEFAACSVWEAAAQANISHSYWHYSSYCNTGPAFGNRTVPTDTFGACILGWDGGRPKSPCDKP